MIRLGTRAARELGSGPLLTVGVAVEMASTVVSVPLRQLVCKPDCGGNCLSSSQGNLEPVMSTILSRAQGKRSGLAHSGRKHHSREKVLMAWRNEWGLNHSYPSLFKQLHFEPWFRGHVCV